MLGVGRAPGCWVKPTSLNPASSMIITSIFGGVVMNCCNMFGRLGLGLGLELELGLGLIYYGYGLTLMPSPSSSR